MQRIFPLASASRPAMGHTQPPVQWVPGVLSPGVKCVQGMMLTTHPHLVLRLRMSRSYTSSHPKRLLGMQWDNFTFYRMNNNKLQHLLCFMCFNLYGERSMNYKLFFILFFLHHISFIWFDGCNLVIYFCTYFH
jgi:hypothetical protein